MDSKTANYQESRYVEIKEAVEQMLVRVGWAKNVVSESVPFLPISGWEGDNLVTKSQNMTWWEGQTVKQAVGTGQKVRVQTLYEAFRSLNVLFLTLHAPISGVYKIKGIGDVLTGRVEQGSINPQDEVCFLPSHTASNRKNILD